MATQDDTLFADAMALHRRYCDRRDTTHECVGRMSVRRGEVCLDCPLCGKGDSWGILKGFGWWWHEST